MKTQEQMKSEALRCMEAMQLSKQCINAFKNRNEIWTSEQGILFNDEDYADIAKKIENEHGGLVYHIDHTIYEFGECLSMFYVSQYGEDDDLDETLQDIEDGYAFCYVYNMSSPEFSEFGTIAFKPVFGGVKRIS